MDQYLGRKLTLRALGLVGASIFAAFFVLTYVTPNWVENFATEFIENEARHRVEQSIDRFRLFDDDSSLSRLARSVDRAASPELEKWIQELHDGVRIQWELALETIRDLDCECRERLSQVLEETFRLDFLPLMAPEDQVFEFIQLNYAIVVNELKRDIRIFSASNAAVFILLLLVSFLKPQAITHLFLPGVLLGMSTLICSYFYIFEQNWLLTIIHSSYLGFAYLAWLGVVFLFLCDIVFNRGRITTEILNAIFNAIGSAFSVVPC